MALAYQDLMEENPEYENIVNSLPRKIYSGKGMSDVSGFFFLL